MNLHILSLSIILIENVSEMILKNVFRILFPLIFFSSCILNFSQNENFEKDNAEIINIGSRLEIFIDDYLIDTLKNINLKLHHPIDRGPVLYFDNPWEGNRDP